ncbi:hypothetical protein CB0940_01197 [Cercospora beticola]|uniref:Protein DSF2 n=1 Tax=Cercospora beticola TaxID=122368 RepID=A0A2G5IAS4_CERBT|nr:hypothetical protein CB0940_01197 [Cercospora beticola]PIB01889.1 hypothetical protein CB0940_01197 [Cercospora beticola]WPA96627.1 hypothetical protein RHO25_001234 [Cercospora beticola]CAK1355030.1 unnamed protein product [Cercospora beticola]
MPGLRDILKKKDKISNEAQPAPAALAPPAPEFTIIRSTTNFQEILEPPAHPQDDNDANRPRDSKEKRRSLGLRGFSSSSAAKDLSPEAHKSSQQLGVRPRGERRLSDRLHLHRRDRSRSASAETSSNLPEDLPAAPQALAARPKEKSVDDAATQANKEQQDQEQEQREAQWEKRATMLAMSSPFRETGKAPGPSRSRSPSISDASGDINIQEAIRLHEEGKLKESSEMFGALANPKGANNALAAVLYGLALRHGWGIPIDAEKAIYYLSLAASNSASVEEQALASGMKKGGSARGELVLAIFELANCFRNGWGVAKDPVAARQYYETAANLGDTDAMEEAAWCYLEGFGGAKDKFKAAQYLRLAESRGSKGVSQSWIWKDKYNPK